MMTYCKAKYFSPLFSWRIVEIDCFRIFTFITHVNRLGFFRKKTTCNFVSSGLA